MTDRIYRHKKTGGLYRVVFSEAVIEATLETAVVYRSVDDGPVWVRPYAEFFDGRFEQVDL